MAVLSIMILMPYMAAERPFFVCRKNVIHLVQQILCILPGQFGIGFESRHRISFTVFELAGFFALAVTFTDHPLAFLPMAGEASECHVHLFAVFDDSLLCSGCRKVRDEPEQQCYYPEMPFFLDSCLS